MIIIIIIAVAILSYFGVDLKEFFASEQFRKNWGYITNFISEVWVKYLADPASYLWGIWVTYIWTPFINFLKK